MTLLKFYFIPILVIYKCSKQMVKLLLKMDEIPKPDDAADAIACAITHCQAGVARSQFMMK